MFQTTRPSSAARRLWTATVPTAPLSSWECGLTLLSHPCPGLTPWAAGVTPPPNAHRCPLPACPPLGASVSTPVPNWQLCHVPGSLVPPPAQMVVVRGWDGDKFGLRQGRAPGPAGGGGRPNFHTMTSQGTRTWGPQPRGRALRQPPPAGGFTWRSCTWAGLALRTRDAEAELTRPLRMPRSSADTASVSSTRSC